MANDAKASCKAKDAESNDSKGRKSASRSSTSLGTVPDTSNLRRSVRETTSKKNMTPNPSIIRKSERLEKRTPTTPPVKRKSERVEKQSLSSPLRRSERGKKQSSSSSSGSKKPGKSLGPSVMKKKHKKERSVKQLTRETEEVAKSEEHVIKAIRVELKRMDARAYRTLFKRKQKKANLEGHHEEMETKKVRLPQNYSTDARGGVSENADGGSQCSQREVEGLEECISKVSEKKLKGNSLGSDPAEEPLEDDIGLKFSHSSQELSSLEEGHQFKEGDSQKDLKGEDNVALSSHRTSSKLADNVAEMEQEKLKAEWVAPAVNRTPGDDTEVHLEGGSKLMPSKCRRNVVDMDSDATSMPLNKDNCTSNADTALYECSRNDGLEKCAACFKRQRVNHDLKQQEHCSCSTKLNQDLCGASLAKDGTTEQLPSLLDHPSNLKGSESLVTISCDKTKERLSKNIANGCKPDSSMFKEYWVPVQLSPMQLEQYCTTLLLNSSALCSSSRNDIVGALRDILISAQKCCDHPYIMDPPMQFSLTKDRIGADILDVGIKASGKLQLLDAMLLGIKVRRLRVLVLFQSSGGSGKDNIGDILDDFVRQRFGQGSYERIDGHVLPSRKQAALNNFNNHQEGRFVFLLETRACSSSIKLSSVDIVIIFASDWNPMTDIRNLQKITLHSQFEQINVFRLYSSCTVEEKVLLLARQDKTLDSNLQSINRAASHMLLMWGASYLFKKLSEFHHVSNPATSENALFEQSLLKDVIQEFSCIVPQEGKNNNPSNSIVLEVEQNQGCYSTNFPLHGEPKIQLLHEELPHIFWKKLLEGKQPQWKYISGPPQRSRKRVQYFDDTQNKTEVEADEVVKKRKKEANNNTDLQSPKASLTRTSRGSLHNTSQPGPSSVGLLDANHTSNSTHLNNNLSQVSKVSTIEYGERMNLHDSQNSLHQLMKPEIAELSETLRLPEDVKVIVLLFLEYVLNNHHVNREPSSILQAFQISLCWTAASLLKHKLDHKESLSLAKQKLNFDCKKEEADFVYSKLRCLKTVFLYHTGISKVAGSPKSAEFLSKDLSENQLNGRSSLSNPSHLLKQKMEVESLAPGQEFSNDQIACHLGWAQKDYSKSIKDIEKKCNKQMRKLLQRQQVEREELEKKYDKEKAQLAYKQRAEAAVIRFHNSSAMRTDKLKMLDIQYAKYFEELEHQREMGLNNLLAMQLATRNKLQKRKADWIEGVNVWALAELTNKPLANMSGYDQENPVTLNSISKEQIPEQAHNALDGELPLEVPETVSSNEDVFPRILTTSEPVSEGGTSNMLDSDVPLKVPRSTSVRDVLENVVSVDALSCQEQNPDVQLPEAISSSDGPENTIHESSSEGGCDRAASMAPERGFPLGVTENVTSTGGLMNAASVNPSPSEGQTSAGTTSCMDARKILLDMPEAAPREAEDGNIIMEKSSVSVMVSYNSNIVNQQKGAIHVVNQDSLSDNIVALAQENGEVMLRVSETCGVNQQDDVAASSANETRCDIAGKNGAGQETSGVCVPASSCGTAVDHHAGVLSSGWFQVATSEELEGGFTGQEIDRGHAIASDNCPGVRQPDGMVYVTDQDGHSQESSLANSPPIIPATSIAQDGPVLLNQVPQYESLPTDSSRLQDGAAQVCDNQVAFQLVEASASQPVVADAPVSEHFLQLLPSIDSVTGSRPITSGQHVPVDSIAVGTSGMHVSTMRTEPATFGSNNRHATAPAVRMPFSMSQDPLQNELDRLRKETDQIIKIHEDTKLQLKSDCEKEIEEAVAQIRRKHDSKLQEIESEFLRKKKEMDDNQNIVLMNKILAEAFRTKCMDTRAASTPGRQQELPSTVMQQLLQQSQPIAQRPSIVIGPYATGLSAGSTQSTPTSSLPTPPLQVVHCSALFSGAPTRPLHISSISPNIGDFPVGSEIRAPAPHLQLFRPSTSISATGLPSFPSGALSQQAPTTSPTHSDISSSAPASAQQPSPHIIDNCHETMGIMPSSSSLSRLESFVDVMNQTSKNATQPCSFPPITDVSSKSNLLVHPEICVLNSARTNPGSEVVCLSDDD